jgi:hypothetical protein
MEGRCYEISREIGPGVRTRWGWWCRFTRNGRIIGPCALVARTFPDALRDEASAHR